MPPVVPLQRNLFFIFFFFFFFTSCLICYNVHLHNFSLNENMVFLLFNEITGLLQELMMGIQCCYVNHMPS